MSPAFPTLAEIVEIHRDQLERYGGRPGILDLGLLQSAAAMPEAGIRGRYFHAFPWEMAAAYLFHIVQNHPFVDGNKRVGTAAALVFLGLNGIEVDVPSDDLVRLVLDAATGRADKAAIALFLEKHRSKG